MKLRNKKTGETRAFDEVMREAYKWNSYNSLAELNDEWEDVPEEPKKKTFVWIDYDGEVIEDSITPFDNDVKRLKAIGNYFETKEEAEREVEKLKAWKRLKDKGFKFKWWVRTTDNFGDTIEITATSPMMTCSEELDTIFGGEDE